ncbi:Uncharacterised protein [Mycolicibacterium vanbaalenii]|uniref:Integral membrane protein n=1 Tax=Mycolicibacterium vanbaalenii TaxID=110539 RepID=A0A5S9R539_MYCVN|nr:hypothetical protein [Mycolicibacterium vanbaalenii]CAA0130847.1 Uncharacterised protein [Mycolicibacterium vanbaalenii]
MSAVISPDSKTAAAGQPFATTSKRDIWIVFSIVPAFYAAFGAIFFLLARTMPPPRPDVTTEQKVEFFTTHGLTIQIGFGFLILIVGGAGVANGIVVYHMKRMSAGSTMAYVYMGGMAVGALPGCLLVAFCFLVAAFRPDRDPEVLALLYDLGCLSYVGSLGCFTAAYFGFAIAILYDRNRIFPKWLGYVTIWQIVTEIMAVPVFISPAGPFAWNGSMSFWTGTVIFGFWLSCVIFFLKKANEEQPADQAPLP